jgi:hypothetical protein
MKKLIPLSIALIMYSGITYAQGIRIGLKAIPNIGWTSPEDAKVFIRSGAKMRFGYGLITEFKFLKFFALATGFEVNWYGGKMNTNDSSMFYTPAELIAPNSDTKFRYLLKERAYKVNYFEVPLCLKMKTPEIGPMTYFANFGLQIGVRGKAIAQDVGTLVKTVSSPAGIISTSKTAEDRPDVDVRPDFNLFRASLNVGAGLEYKLIGPTALLFSVNYLSPFTNLLKSTPEQLSTARTLSTEKLKTVLKSNAVAFSVGLIF